MRMGFGEVGRRSQACHKAAPAQRERGLGVGGTPNVLRPRDPCPRRPSCTRTQPARHVPHVNWGWNGDDAGEGAVGVSHVLVEGHLDNTASACMLACLQEPTWDQGDFRQLPQHQNKGALLTAPTSRLTGTKTQVMALMSRVIFRSDCAFTNTFSSEGEVAPGCWYVTRNLKAVAPLAGSASMPPQRVREISFAPGEIFL
jgi:hypothetical protein